jgi:hypothetical protein
VFQNKIAGCFREDSTPACTEGNEHRRISLLQMWKPAFDIDTSTAAMLWWT